MKVLTAGSISGGMLTVGNPAIDKHLDLWIYTGESMTVYISPYIHVTFIMTFFAYRVLGWHTKSQKKTFDKI